MHTGTDRSRESDRRLRRFIEAHERLGIAGARAICETDERRHSDVLHAIDYLTEILELLRPESGE